MVLVAAVQHPQHVACEHAAKGQAEGQEGGAKGVAWSSPKAAAGHAAA